MDEGCVWGSGPQLVCCPITSHKKPSTHDVERCSPGSSHERRIKGSSRDGAEEAACLCLAVGGVRSANICRMRHAAMERFVAIKRNKRCGPELKHSKIAQSRVEKRLAWLRRRRMRGPCWAKLQRTRRETRGRQERRRLRRGCQKAERLVS